MKKISILGAAGITGKYITRKMQSEKDFEVKHSDTYAKAYEIGKGIS